MEVEKFINGNNTTDHGEEQNDNKEDHDHDQDQDHQVDLPGFRFHPTDEELVGFYLKRKVEKKPISIELIKHIDVYKYDPWDLPRVSNVGDKEWYFFCIRGRKYKNSIRPNRVTGSGFWKATGIDKPIYSVKEPHDCIGLKKSLVYYRGSAGKGTKTDWMMHEFRLPPNDGKTTAAATTAADFPSAKEHVVNAQEAEVWTLCRIFKRIPSYKRYVPTDDNVQNLKGNTTPRKSSSSSISMVDDTSSKTCSLETNYNDPNYYASLEPDSDHRHHNRNAQFPQRNKRSSSSSAKPVISSDQQHSEDRDHEYQMSRGSWFHLGHLYNNNNFVDIPLAAARQQYHQGPIFPGSYPSFNINPNTADHDFFTNGSWDELRSVVQLAVDHHPSQIYDVTDKS